MIRAAFVLAVFLLLWSDIQAKAAPSLQKKAAVADAPVPDKLLRDDPLLQTPVTLDVVEQPLGEVLTSLNPALKIDLTAEQNVADQRVTLHVTSQTLYALMGQLLVLLSHDPARPHGYHWGLLDQSVGGRPDYQLWRDEASVAQEQEARDYPRRQLAVMLRDLRQSAQLSPQDTAAIQADAPQKSPNVDDPYFKAYRNLTDDQIAALVNGETIPLDPSLFTEEIADQWQGYRTGIVQGHLQAVAAGRPDPISTEPPPPAIRVVPLDKDNDEDQPEQIGKYGIYLDGILGDSRRRNLNTYDTPQDPDPIFLKLPDDVGPRVDLTPYFSAKTVTPQERGDLGLTLQALAKAAHINIYQESFLRTSTIYGLPHPGLDTLQGSVPRLVVQICALWNYHAQPVPGGYLFWSRTWAQDRGQDVPERLIAPWRKRLQKNGELNIYDRGEIDAALTWPQVALTLDVTLPEAGENDGIETYRILNLFGNLTPSEQKQALSSDGLLVSDMSARGQAALASDYQKPLRDVPGNRLMQAVLKFRTEDAPEFKIQRLIMNIDADGQSLLKERCVISVKAAVVTAAPDGLAAPSPGAVKL